MKDNIKLELHEDTYPSISVIIPVYNEEKNIGRCLESIKNHDYPRERIEIIVVDDGSSDQSVNIARKHGVKVLRQKNKGPGVARNKGVYEASGDIVAFIDADDVAKKSWLNDCLVHFNDKKIAGVGCINGLLNRKNDFVIFSYLERYFRLVSSVKTDHVGASGSVYRRDILLSVDGFNPKFRAAEDINLSNKITKKGYALFLIKKPLIDVQFPDTLLEYSLSQIKKSAYVVYSHLTSERTSKKSSSYTDLKDSIQSVMPFVFLFLAVLSPNITLTILLGMLLFSSLIYINGSYIQFVFHNRDKEKLSRFWLVALQFYLIVRALVWSVGLLYGFYLTISEKLRSRESNTEVWR